MIKFFNLKQASILMLALLLLTQVSLAGFYVKDQVPFTETRVFVNGIEVSYELLPPFSQFMPLNVKDGYIIDITLLCFAGIIHDHFSIGYKTDIKNGVLTDSDFITIVSHSLFSASIEVN